MIRVIFQQFLADPCFSQADAIGYQYTIIAGQDLACLPDSVLLELAEFDGGTSSRRLIFSLQLITEIFKDSFGVDLVRCILLAPELGGVEQFNQFCFKIASLAPVLTIPGSKFFEGKETGYISSKGARLCC